MFKNTSSSDAKQPDYLKSLTAGTLSERETPFKRQIAERIVPRDDHSQICPFCKRLVPNLFVHANARHLPWFVSFSTSCLKCRMQLNFRGRLLEHARNVHQSESHRIKPKLWWTCMKQLFEMIAKTLNITIHEIPLYVHVQYDAWKDMDSKIHKDPVYGNYYRDTPLGDKPYDPCNPDSLLDCTHWRIVLKLLAVAGLDAHLVKSAYPEDGYVFNFQPISQTEVATVKEAILFSVPDTSRRQAVNTLYEPQDGPGELSRSHRRRKRKAMKRKLQNEATSTEQQQSGQSNNSKMIEIDKEKKQLAQSDEGKRPQLQSGTTSTKQHQSSQPNNSKMMKIDKEKNPLAQPDEGKRPQLQSGTTSTKQHQANHLKNSTLGRTNKEKKPLAQPPGGKRRQLKHQVSQPKKLITIGQDKKRSAQPFGRTRAQYMSTQQPFYQGQRPPQWHEGRRMGYWSQQQSGATFSKQHQASQPNKPNSIRIDQGKERPAVQHDGKRVQYMPTQQPFNQGPPPSSLWQVTLQPVRTEGMKPMETMGGTKHFGSHESGQKMQFDLDPTGRLSEERTPIRRDHVVDADRAQSDIQTRSLHGDPHGVWYQMPVHGRPPPPAHSSAPVEDYLMEMVRDAMEGRRDLVTLPPEALKLLQKVFKEKRLREESNVEVNMVPSTELPTSSFKPNRQLDKQISHQSTTQPTSIPDKQHIDTGTPSILQFSHESRQENSQHLFAGVRGNWPGRYDHRPSEVPSASVTDTLIRPGISHIEKNHTAREYQEITESRSPTSSDKRVIPEFLDQLKALSEGMGVLTDAVMHLHKTHTGM